jgi:hypothetical protein
MSARITDHRAGAGRPSAHVEQPTYTIPADCACSWSVVRAGPGRECVSRLIYRNALCAHRHVPKEVSSD